MSDMHSRQPIGVRPSYPARSGRHFELACWAATRAALRDIGERDPVAVARTFGEVGEIVVALLRAAVSGAVTTTPAWAGTLAATGVSDFLLGLVPQSAMATVISRGTIIPLDEYAQITVPFRVPVAAGTWVGEAQPIPLTALTLSPATLSPHKAAVLLTFSRELAQNANAEAIFTTMLRASAAATIDALYLSAAAGGADSASGLLNGVSALTGTGSPLGDLTLLARTCQGLDGSGETIFVTTPALASSLALRNDIAAGTTILASVAVPAGRLIGIDPAGIVHTVNPAPSIEASEETTLHLDSVPLNLATGAQGSGVLATPTQSMWQTNQIALRSLIDLGWLKWRADSVQFIDAVTWA